MVVQGHRSGLEDKISAQLAAAGVPTSYEKHKLKYKQPEIERTYTPDFALYRPDGTVAFYIEGKGRFTAEDRKKQLMVRNSNPGVEIRFLFQRSKTKLNKGAKSTYADWCNKHGFVFADGVIPDQWFRDAEVSIDPNDDPPLMF